MPHSMRSKSYSSRTKLNRNESITSTGIAYQTHIVKERTAVQIESFKNEYTITDHLITIEQLEARYETSVTNGLKQRQADTKLLLDGPNCLASPPEKPKYLLLLEFLFCGFNALLWVASIISFVVYGLQYLDSDVKIVNDQLYFGAVVVTVIVLTGLFGFYQEAANVSIIESFKKMSPKTARVVRDGVEKVIPSEEIVLGDLVLLTAGEWIAADMRLVQVSSLKVDNSAITGETVAQSRSVDCTDPVATETANIAFFSTGVIEGSGRGIVINRGDDSLIGRIAGLTSSLAKGQTPIRREINYFIKFITILSLVIGAAYFGLCLLYGYDFITSFAFFIAIVIANVPEGLPVTLTACMTLTCKRMASKNCLVKKLEAIETLGCCNVICSDKTGTLTQNKMTVAHLYYDNQAYYVLVDGDSLEMESEAYQALTRIAINCSRASFIIGEEHLVVDQRQTTGDASETAILKAMEKLVGNVTHLRREFPKVCEIPFNSTNKYQLSIHRLPSKQHVLLMKGAPERIIDRCDRIIRFEATVPFADEFQKNIKKAIEQLGRRGERVLAFADLELDTKTYKEDYAFDPDRLNFPTTKLRFVGLISMIDPPRPSVPDAVAKCKTAGIRVIMVTGDHPLTAAAIARQVGILSKDSVTSYDIAVKREVSHSMMTEKEWAMCNAAVYTGGDLREMNTEQLENCLLKYQEIVFARTSPQQKLKIVEAFQHLGNIVAVTGDGINDSPALKKADIGVAMGISGSDVSKEAADMILLDDNFSSIVTGIEEGRLIFDNLKKSIAYLLTSNVPEIIPFVLMIIYDLPQIASVLAIMVIDVGTDLWPAISMAYEKSEADIMHRKPRDPHYDKLVNSRLIFLTYGQIGIIQTFASIACYYLTMYEHGFNWESLDGMRDDWVSEKNITNTYGIVWSLAERKILTEKCYSAFFLSIVITQIADLLICKTRKLSLFQQGMTNWVMNAGIMVEIIIAFLVVYCPGLHTVLGFEPIHPAVLLTTLPFAILIFLFDETRKLLIRKYPHGIVDRETYY